MTDASPCGHIDRQVKLVPNDLLWQIQKAKTQAHSAWLLLEAERKAPVAFMDPSEETSETPRRGDTWDSWLNEALSNVQWATRTLDALEYQIRTGNTLHEKD